MPWTFIAFVRALLFIMAETLISEEAITMTKLHYSKSLQLQLQINHVSRNIKTGDKCRLLFTLCSINLGCTCQSRTIRS